MKPSPRKAVIAAATMLTLFAFALSANSIPPLATTMAREFGTRYESFGYIFLLYGLAFAAAALVGGWQAERRNMPSRHVVLAGLAMMAVTLSAGAGLPGMLACAVWILFLGVANGLVETFGSVMITDLEGPDSSKLMNLSQVFFCIGAILAPQVVAALFETGTPWRGAFLIFAAVAAVVAVLFAFGARGYKAAHAPPPGPDGKPSPHSYTEPLFVLMALSLLTYVAAEQAVACWISSWFETRFALPPAAAARRLSLFWSGIIAGRLAVLALPRRWTLWPTMLTAGSVMALSYLLLCLPLSPRAATVLLAINGFASGPLWPTIVATCKVLRNSPRFTGGVIAGGALGAAFGPMGASVVIRHAGPEWLFPALAMTGLLMLAVTVGARLRMKMERPGR